MGDALGGDMSMLKQLVLRLPKPLKLRLRQLAGWPLDLLDRLRGLDPQRLPPRGLIYTGRGDFVAIGEEFLQIFIEQGGLQPDDTVLDIGCGIGRMALPLTGYLQAGSYHGFDIVPEGIDWCQRNISSRYPHFHFTLADLHNRTYNPQGRQLAAEFVFPYEAAQFRFVFATSVLTHLLPDALQNYLQQCARVMRDDGCALLTCFVLDEQARELLTGGHSQMAFRQQAGEPFAVVDPDMPENAIAYDLDYLQQCVSRAGLVLNTWHPGSWCGREHFLSFQDVLLLRCA